jgi:hypothetical protein
LLQGTDRTAPHYVCDFSLSLQLHGFIPFLTDFNRGDFLCFAAPSDSILSKDAGIEPRTVATLDRRSKHLALDLIHSARSHPQWMRLPDFAYQTIIFLQSYKKKIFCFFPDVPCLFRAFAKNSKPVIIYFILLRITITMNKYSTKR